MSQDEAVTKTETLVRQATGMLSIKPRSFNPGRQYNWVLKRALQPSYYQYNRVTGTVFTRGRFLCSLTLKILGDSPAVINNLRYTEDKSLINLIEKVVELQG